METVNVLSKDLRTVIRKEVPFIPGAWVDFFDSITTGAIRKAQKAQKDQSMDLSMELLLSQIADWNFSGEDKKALSLTLDSLDLLPMKLLNWIAEAQGEILKGEEDKKKEDQQAVDNGPQQ